MAILAVFSVFVMSSAGWAATYYVDATNGNDDNSGTAQATAWKTISKVNSSSFNPGDSILFKRGDFWREQLNVPSSGSSGNPITFGAYGTGNKPVISGADLIRGWSLSGDNVWQVSVTTQPNIVMFDGIVGNKQSFLADVDSEYDWYWENNTFYVYSTIEALISIYIIVPSFFRNGIFIARSFSPLAWASNSETTCSSEFLG